MNKYANKYLESLLEAIKGVPTISVVGGLGGALAGAGVGSAVSPGEDEEGNPKSRIPNALIGAALGGVAGGAGGQVLANNTNPVVRGIRKFVRDMEAGMMPSDTLGQKAHQVVQRGSNSVQNLLDRYATSWRPATIGETASEIKNQLTGN